MCYVIIDHKFLLPGHSFLVIDSALGVIGIASRENNLMYVNQNFFEAIKTCQKDNKFILTNMKRVHFFQPK